LLVSEPLTIGCANKSNTGDKNDRSFKNRAAGEFIRALIYVGASVVGYIILDIRKQIFPTDAEKLKQLVQKEALLNEQKRQIDHLGANAKTGKEKSDVDKLHKLRQKIQKKHIEKVLKTIESMNNIPTRLLQKPTTSA